MRLSVIDWSSKSRILGSRAARCRRRGCGRWPGRRAIRPTIRATGSCSACRAGPVGKSRGLLFRCRPRARLGSSILRPKAGCLRNLLSSIGQTRARIRSTEPVIRCGSSTRSTSTSTPSLPSELEDALELGEQFVAVVGSLGLSGSGWPSSCGRRSASGCGGATRSSA